MSESEFIRHEVKEISFFIGFGIVMSIILPLLIGFSFKGFEESFVDGKPLEFGAFLTTYLIYYIFIVGGLIGLPTLKIRELFLTNRSDSIARQKKPDPFAVAILHDPERDGALYRLFSMLGMKGKRNPMRFSISMLRMFIIGALVFGGLGIAQVAFPQAQVVDLPTIQFQQVTPTMEVLFTAEPPAFAETTLMLFVLSILVGLVVWLMNILRLPEPIFWFIVFVVICPLIGLGWMSFHSIVYGNSEASLFATFIFGWLGSTITMLFGTWILWYSWHFYNNLFAKIIEVSTRPDDVVFISLIAWFLLLAVWLSGEFAIRKYRKGSPYIAEPAT